MSETPATQPLPVPADDAAHLLIVDDDRRIRELLQRFLAQQGYRVTLAASAEEALASLKNFSFDLIVLDVMMPGQNGFDLAAQLYEQMMTTPQFDEFLTLKAYQYV